MDGEGQVRVWDIKSGRQVGAFGDSHSGPVTLMKLSPRGDVIATANPADNRVRVWSAKTYALLQEVVPLAAPSSLAFSYDGKRFAVGTQRGAVHVWPAPAATPPRRR